MEDEGDKLTGEIEPELRKLNQLIEQMPPESVAYAIIKMFFTANNISEKSRLYFMSWLTDENNCEAKDRALEWCFYETLEESRNSPSKDNENGWKDLRQRLKII